MVFILMCCSFQGMIEDAALMFIKEQCVEECDATKPIKVIMPGYKKNPQRIGAGIKNQDNVNGFFRSLAIIFPCAF
jgi:hypothetical protein